ncbi:MAG: hypothetical protein AAF992_11615 [Bacteroidota bacterium]
MGAIISDIHFEDDIPDFSRIKDTFFQRTGLHLEILAALDLTASVSNLQEVVASLAADSEESQKLGRTIGRYSRYIHLIDVEYPYLSSSDSIDLPDDFLDDVNVAKRLKISVEELLELKRIESDDLIGAFNERYERLNKIGYLSFYNDIFYPIMADLKDKLIRLHYFVGQSYFPLSLEKTLLQLGGRFNTYNDNKTAQEYLRKKQHKLNRLRRWSEYYWFNRPRK